MNTIAPAQMVSESVSEVNQVLKMAQAETTEMSKKLLSVNTAMRLGKEIGKGELVDITA